MGVVARGHGLSGFGRHRAASLLAGGAERYAEVEERQDVRGEADALRDMAEASVEVTQRGCRSEGVDYRHKGGT